MIKIMGLIAAAVLLTAAIAPAARADSTAFVASPLYTIIGSGPVNLGMVFTANSNITVDALGYFDIFDSYGIIVAPATVAIYDSSGNLLSSTVVSPGSPVVDGYFYQAITPINLTAGNQYTVDEFSSDGNWAYSFGAPLTTDPDITYNYFDYVSSGSLEFPTNTAGLGPYFGPDFFFTQTSTVPEPSTLFLFFTGLLGVAGAARKRYLT